MRRELPPAAVVTIIVLAVALAGIIFWRYAGTSDPAHLPREEVLDIWKKAGGAPPPGYQPRGSGGQQGATPGAPGGAPPSPPR